jgi:hypothetical protein
MTRNELQSVLLICIREVQEMCGKRTPELSLDTCPFYELEDFDSLTAVETTELLSRRIGKRIQCGKDDLNVFIAKDGRTPIKLSDVLDRLECLIEK